MTMETLQTQINRWLNYIENVIKLSPRTIESYTSDIKLFIEYCEQQNIKSLQELSLSSLHGFVESMSSINANSTINRRIACLKNLFNYMLTIGELEENITSGLKVRKLKKTTPKALTLDEAKLIIELGYRRNMRDGLIVEILLMTGLRSFELSNIKNEDIRNNILLVTSGKGDKQREIPLSDYLVNKIEKYKEYKKKCKWITIDTDYLFVNRMNNPLTEDNVQNLMKTLFKEIGREDLSCHKTRSTFASLLNKNGVGIATIQSLLGHNNVQTTIRYLAVDQETKREAILNNPLLMD